MPRAFAAGNARTVCLFRGGDNHHFTPREILRSRMTARTRRPRRLKNNTAEKTKLHRFRRIFKYPKRQQVGVLISVLDRSSPRSVVPRPVRTETSRRPDELRLGRFRTLHPPTRDNAPNIRTVYGPNRAG